MDKYGELLIYRAEFFKGLKDNFRIDTKSDVEELPKTVYVAQPKGSKLYFVL